MFLRRPRRKVRDWEVGGRGAGGGWSGTRPGPRSAFPSCRHLLWERRSEQAWAGGDGPAPTAEAESRGWELRPRCRLVHLNLAPELGRAQGSGWQLWAEWTKRLRGHSITGSLSCSFIHKRTCPLVLDLKAEPCSVCPARATGNGSSPSGHTCRTACPGWPQGSSRFSGLVCWGEQVHLRGEL